RHLFEHMSSLADSVMCSDANFVSHEGARRSTTKALQPGGDVLEEESERQRKSREHWRLERVRLVQRPREPQLRRLARVDLDLPRPPVHNPVLEHSAARVELQLGF